LPLRGFGVATMGGGVVESAVIEQLSGEGLFAIRNEIASLVASVLGEEPEEFAKDKARLIVQHAKMRVEGERS
jgi:hypothetical protein